MARTRGLFLVLLSESRGRAGNWGPQGYLLEVLETCFWSVTKQVTSFLWTSVSPSEN